MQESHFHIAEDGTRIWYGTVGRGPAMVLCDGLACDGFIWPYLIDDFCDDFTMVRWHYRGHGVSENPKVAKNTSVIDFCRDLHGVLEALGLEEVVLVGHSMGVQVILQYYDLYPDQVRALIPLCGSYKYPLDTFHNTDHLRRALPYLNRALNLAPEAIQTVWKTLLPSKLWYSVAVRSAEVNGRLLRQKDFLPYLEHASHMDLTVFLRIIGSLATHSAEHVLPKIAVPTLIVAGEHDTFTPMFRSVEMAELIEASELVIVPSGTHVAPLELPDLVNAAIEKFLVQHALLPPRVPLAIESI
ncbi:MAG: alpha/beta hydrolase [Bradymonadaceae bacterium]|nr:alpha/beta hydrolase [Lujinxingiaceae bacterium]